MDKPHQEHLALLLVGLQVPGLQPDQKSGDIIQISAPVGSTDSKTRLCMNKAEELWGTSSPSLAEVAHLRVGTTGCL